MRYRLLISYRGTAYCGWQWQANAQSVQATVEAAVGSLVGQPVRVQGAGRTDAGVHARGQMAHLDLERAFPLSGLVHGSNERLPEDVRLLAAVPVRPDFHAQFDATGKEYRYRLIRASVLSPLDSWNAVRAPPDLDLELLAAATELLVGRHDFKAFALAGGRHESDTSAEATVRCVTSARWRIAPHADGELEPALAGDGFLRGMVRGVVGTLLEVATGRRPLAAFAALLEGRSRGEAGPTAPARGLTLERIDYAPGWELAH